MELAVPAANPIEVDVVSTEQRSSEPTEPSTEPRLDAADALGAAREAVDAQDSHTLEAASLQLLAIARKTKKEGWD